ncbi:MAG TPA: DUF5661 family protein [Desulfitobacteriaceae bacterium]|jgi:hypothetical protein|nr:DUF5661 family protein [Desulfitobacteriaceae bacterium]
MEKFTLLEAKELARQLGVDFTKVSFTAEEFWAGLHVELEHGLTDKHTNVTNDDPLLTAKIVLAHLNENQLYYDKNIGVAAWEQELDRFKGDPKGKRIQII